MTQYEGFDWGFDMSGTPLGGVGSRSMPGPRALEFLGSPRAQAASQRRNFTDHVERVYEKVNPHNAGLWDPRGEQALSMQPADYIEGSSEQLNPEIKNFEDEADQVLSSGAPRPASGLNPKTNVNFELLSNEASGLSPQMAERFAEVLSAYDPGIVETIAVPRDVSQRAAFVEESGFLQKASAIRNAEVELLFSRNAAERRRPAQTVDRNGVVDKYAAGTGPYDAPGRTRPGGMAGAARGTVFRGAGDSRAQAQPLQKAEYRPQALPTNDDVAPEKMESREIVQQSSDSLDYSSEDSANGISAGKVVGAVGFGLLGLVGLGMLIKGAQ